MFITPAFAQGAPAGGSDMLFQVAPFILIFVIMYFLILRPQQKRAKDHQTLVTQLRRGDTVVPEGSPLFHSPVHSHGGKQTAKEFASLARPRKQPQTQRQGQCSRGGVRISS